MSRNDVPAPARSRLRGLGSPGWGGPHEVEVEPPGPPTRVGWPTAAPGTPAARLRLPVEPPVPRRDLDAPVAWRGRPVEPGWDLDASAARRGQALDPPVSRWDPGAPDPDPSPAPPRPSAWEPVTDAAQRWSEHWSERWLPESWRGARWDPGRGGALALAVVTALAALVAAIGVWSGRPVVEPVPALPAVAAAPAPAGEPAAPGGPVGQGGPGGPGGPARPVAHDGPIVVSVTGKVARPGMTRLPAGSRVGDALEAAGGAADGTDLTGLNLAQRLADGEQVVVGIPLPAPGAPVPGGGVVSGPGGSGQESAPAAGGGGGGSGASGGGAGGGGAGDLVDLNAATLADLDTLPGVGPVTAQKIVDWREQNGRFMAIEQLQEVGGIGEARFAQLRGKVRV